MAEGPNNPQAQNGFDYDFVQDLPDRLCCGICHYAVRDPLLTDCGHLFCSACLARVSNSSSRNPDRPEDQCPECRRKPYKTFLDVRTSREVNNLQVQHRDAEGCDWTGNLKDYFENHVANCGFVTLPCNNCGLPVQRQLMQQHLIDSCEKREYNCEYCGMYKDTYEDVSTKHWPLCNAKQLKEQVTQLQEELRQQQCNAKKQVIQLQEEICQLRQQQQVSQRKFRSLLIPSL